jgi:hypothetical protein
MVDKTDKSTDKNRVQFDFTDEALGALDDLKAKLGLSSRAEVIRYGLRILGWTLEQLESDGKILVEKNGRAQEVVFPFLKKVTQSAGASERAAVRLAR